MTVCIILSITLRVSGLSSDLSITRDKTCLNLSISVARPPLANGGVWQCTLEGVAGAEDISCWYSVARPPRADGGVWQCMLEGVAGIEDISW